ncbi:MAG: hypothetical protein A2Z03_07750 [Chloroflexi bacterium RBG_16_56_8]|nr:MAG: hypothetical protein A2Z03_07750 [Chloroflexi bacterium RBG_16_56_8]
MAIKPAIYVDSSCFIEYAKHQRGISISSDREKDIWILNRVLKAAKNGDIELYTSVMTVVECLHAGDKNNIPAEAKRLFKSILTSGHVLKLVQVDIFIAERARDLHWEHGINVKRIDAIHAASAIEMECCEFLTFDFKRKYPESKKKLEEMGIKVLMPSESEELPEEYRQDDLPGTIS